MSAWIETGHKRSRAPEPKVRISFHADPSVLDRFDDLAWERRMARAELLREVMQREVREARKRGTTQEDLRS